LTLIQSIPSPARNCAISGSFAGASPQIPDMAAFALGPGDDKAQHFQHTWVPLVEVKGDDLGIAVDTQGQQRQIVRTDRNPSNCWAKASIWITSFEISHIT
jgi:hypothetical protein